MVGMELSEDMDSRFRFLHLPIIPSAFHFGVLKTLKKKCKVCDPSDVVPHDNYMTSNMNNRLGRPTAYLFSQTAWVHTSSVRCRNSTDEGRVKSVVLYLQRQTLTRDILPLTELSRDAVAVSEVTLQFKIARAAECRQ